MKVRANPITTKNPSPSTPPMITTQMIQRRFRDGFGGVMSALLVWAL
jgi:hypothetical protein